MSSSHRAVTLGEPKPRIFPSRLLMKSLGRVQESHHCCSPEGVWDGPGLENSLTARHLWLLMGLSGKQGSNLVQATGTWPGPEASRMCHMCVNPQSVGKGIKSRTKRLSLPASTFRDTCHWMSEMATVTPVGTHRPLCPEVFRPWFVNGVGLSQLWAYPHILYALL